jgi:soluble lytic murein transglycosylase
VRKSVLILGLALSCQGQPAIARNVLPDAGPPPPLPEAFPGPAVPFSAADVEPYFPSGPGQIAVLSMQRGEWSQAHDALATLLGLPETQADAAVSLRIRFLLGLTSARLELWSDAAAHLDAARVAPHLADYALYHAARAYYFLGDLARAEERLSQIAHDAVLSDEARLLLGDVLRSRHKWKEVAALYASYLSDPQNGIRRAEARFRLAEAQERLGRRVPLAALDAYHQITVEEPVGEWAPRARERVAKLLGKVPRKQRARYLRLGAKELVVRGKAYFEAMRNPESEADFAAALGAEALDAELACEAHYLGAQSVFKQRQRARSGPLFDDAIGACEKIDNADTQMRAAYQAGRGWASSDAPDARQQAILRFQRAEAWHPEHSFADDARLRQAEQWAALADKDPAATAKVEQLLSTLPDLYPDGDMRAEALWRLAWAAYRKGDYAAAVSRLDQQIAAVPHDENYFAEGQAQYWKARSLVLLGQKDAAREAYVACVRQYPLSYYALLALNRLREHDPGTFTMLTAELRTPPSSWTAGQPAFTFAPRAVYAQPGFARAVELLRLGLGKEAERELARLGLRPPDGRKKVTDPARTETLWATALLYDRAGRYDKSHWIARWSVLDYKRAWPTVANRARWDIAYPRAYWPLLESAAHAQGFPPELLIAFVREESAFDPIQESFANAIGLTQMILPTAQRFGKDLGFAINREALRDPQKNVAVGSRWLKFLWDKFDERVGLVVEGYNAGEGAVGRWLCQRGDWPLDEFAEAVPFDETRNYSKRVLSSYFVYAYLKDETIPLVPNDIPARVIPRQKCP